MRVPDTAQSIFYAIQGNIDGLKYLFSHNLASPMDVSVSRGFSLVRWALYGGMRNYATVQFLLSQGAQPDLDSYGDAWDAVYRRRCTAHELDQLHCILLEPPNGHVMEWAEEQQFPRIHEIILNRSPTPRALKDELLNNPAAVHITDAGGRTALHWATARAQLEDMRLLIEAGSCPNAMDDSGRTTVLHAVDSQNDKALRIVLEAGANPNPEVPKDKLRSSPLIAASFGGRAEMIELLIEFGAIIDVCNPEGLTALQVVSRMQNAECAEILLTNGADLNHMSSNGHTPLTTAILYNNHDVLRLFINQCPTGRLNGPPLLPIIAEYADEETMSIIALSDLLLEQIPLDGFAAGRKTLQSRRDNNENLGRAFEKFLSAAEAVDRTIRRLHCIRAGR